MTWSRFSAADTVSASSASASAYSLNATMFVRSGTYLIALEQ